MKSAKMEKGKENLPAPLLVVIGHLQLAVALPVPLVLF